MDRWQKTIESYRRFAANRPSLQPMAALVQELSTNAIVADFWPSTSHEQLILCQSRSTWNVFPVVSVTPELDAFRISLNAGGDRLLRTAQVELASALRTIERAAADLRQLESAGFARGYYLPCDIAEVALRVSDPDGAVNSITVDAQGTVRVTIRGAHHANSHIPVDSYHGILSQVASAWLNTAERQATGELDIELSVKDGTRLTTNIGSQKTAEEARRFAEVLLLRARRTDLLSLFTSPR